MLNDFTLTFFDDSSLTNEANRPQPRHTLDLLVGVNGSGKSSLLHALADIFQALYRGDIPEFDFRIRYILQKHDGNPQRILISNLGADDRRLSEHPLRLTVDNGTEIYGPIVDSQYLPDWVIALTSGNEQGWLLPESAGPQANGARARPPIELAELRRWYLRERPAGVAHGVESEALQSQYLFLSADLTRLVVLCGLLQNISLRGKTQHARFIFWALRECQLTGLHSFSLTLHPDMLEDRAGDKTFVEQLRQLAQRRIQRGADLTLTFIIQPFEGEQADDRVRPADIIETAGTCLALFRRLANLHRLTILGEVNLFFASVRESQAERIAQPTDAAAEQNEQADQPASARSTNSTLLLFDWLSDGEQSFLGRLSLFAMFEADLPPESTTESIPENQENLASEALILLDEPEVHFNDYWKRQLVLMLTEALLGTPRHVLMTTHSSIALSDVRGANVWKLIREGQYTRRAIQPDIQTLGSDPSDIMVQVFDAENAVGAWTVELIREEIRSARRLRYVEKDIEGSRERLLRLRDSLGSGFWRYLVRQEIGSLEKRGVEE